MNTTVEGKENSPSIDIPFEALKQIGIEIGDELEITTTENALILRLAGEEAENKRLINEATEKVFSRWNNVFVELAKGTNEK